MKNINKHSAVNLLKLFNFMTISTVLLFLISRVRTTEAVEITIGLEGEAEELPEFPSYKNLTMFLQSYPVIQDGEV